LSLTQIRRRCSANSLKSSSENTLTSDWETTNSNKGNPFDQTNKAVALAYKSNAEATRCTFDMLDYSNHIPNGWLTEFDLCVFFNAKFDLHWYRKYGYTLPQRVWCCQLAEFLLEGQKNRFPSLEDACAKYGLGNKIDNIKINYWDKGINTDAIPQDELAEYAIQDVDLTYQVYLKQLEQFQDNLQLFRLFKLLCSDLLTLEEMEWNGLIYDEEMCRQKEQDIEIQIKEITAKLTSIYPGVPINFGSGDQLSAFLYGGTITETYKEHVGFYKSGDKKGQPKYQNAERIHTLPQLFKPLPNTKLKKDGYFKTDEETLRKLKGGTKIKLILRDLLTLSELEKLTSTYYRGIPAINKKMNWPAKELHGQFNQVVAQTGRLSSSKPNLQNLAEDCLDVFVSRYD
jgi:DNA polymerase-1